MRLIDADALKEEVKFQQEHMWPEDLSRRIPGMIDNAPTIAAIPVEWLESQIVPFSDKLKDEVRSVFNATIREMIYRWQQEQEAQNG